MIQIIDINDTFTENIWKVINDPDMVNDFEYDKLISFFSKISKYDSFKILIQDYFNKISSESNMFINFEMFIKKYETYPHRYVKNGVIVDDLHYIAYKIANQLNFLKITCI